MTTLDEAVRFAEEYGYNRWSDARDELSYLRAQLQAAQEERDRAFVVIAEQGMEIERLRGESDRAYKMAFDATEENARLRETNAGVALTPEGTQG